MQPVVRTQVLVIVSGSGRTEQPCIMTRILLSLWLLLWLLLFAVLKAAALQTHRKVACCNVVLATAVNKFNVPVTVR